jgi:hypothetical protein
MMQLQRLETRLRQMEHKKMLLLQKEQIATLNLKYQGWHHAAFLEEIESRSEAEARLRELTLTKL